MSLNQFENKKIILADSLDLLKENKVNFKDSIVIIFIGSKNETNKIFNFFDLLDKKLQKNLEKLSSEISNEFHNNLNINLALKKNITRLFYGQIGLFSHYELISNLVKSNNKLEIYTEDSKIFNIFKNFSELENINIQFNKSKNKENYYKISKLDLLKMYSIDEIKYFLKKKISYSFKNFSNLKDKVFVHLSTEINFISIDNYLNSNWQSKIINIDFKNIKYQKIENNFELNKIFQLAEILIKKYFNNNKYFSESLKLEIESFFQKYLFCYNKIENIFKNLNSEFYFLTKIIRGPLATAIYDYGNSENKKFFWISHQHGHGIELSDIHKKTQITKEETLCDLLFVYSPIGKKKRTENTYIKKNVKILNIGYQTNTFDFESIPKHDIIYISNLNQELAGHEINMSGLNNNEKIIFEENLVTDVFSNIKHSILFKEYPGNKQSNIKSKYFKKLIEPHKNITYFNEWLNAENIYNKSSIILTSLPTSGLAAAINSKKPIVFIDIKQIMPLREDLIKEFDKHFFYFEFNKNIISNLKDFLSQDIENIYNEWFKKETNDKRKFIESYINIKSKKEIINSIKKNITNFI